MKIWKISLAVLVLHICGIAQTTASVSSLPSAPTPQASTTQAGVQNTPMSPQSSAQQSATGVPAPLSLKEAQTLALKNNPQLSVARLNALASHQVTREVRSSLWPTARVDFTAVDANPGT